jgi:hypothetical protein
MYRDAFAGSKNTHILLVIYITVCRTEYLSTVYMNYEVYVGENT